jgi:ribosomal-protein-alanine N-acetyltransferase
MYMGVDITISPLVKADIPEVLEIEIQGQPEPWTERSFLEEIDRLNSYALVARLDNSIAVTEPPPGTRGKIAGYIFFWCVADEIQILNIGVRKDVRGRGIGRLLLERAIVAGEQRNARCVNLEVRESNSAARRLYENFGFRVVGKRPNYYGENTEAAILMELEITPKG